jgi:hypothetical protein
VNALNCDTLGIFKNNASFNAYLLPYLEGSPLTTWLFPASQLNAGDVSSGGMAWFTGTQGSLGLTFQIPNYVANPNVGNVWPHSPYLKVRAVGQNLWGTTFPGGSRRSWGTGRCG